MGVALVREYDYGQPGASAMGCAAHYGAQGSPLVVFTDLPEQDALDVKAIRPGFRPRYAAMDETARAVQSVLVMIEARRREGLPL